MGQIGHMVFEKWLLKDSLYFIVFANNEENWQKVVMNNFANILLKIYA